MNSKGISLEEELTAKKIDYDYEQVKDSIIIDIETTGLDYMENEIFMVQIGRFLPDKRMKVHYLYIDHPEDFQNKEMLLLLNTHTTYAGHNLLFDIPFLLKNNVLNKEEFMHSSASYTLFDTMNVMANVDNLSPSLKPKTLGRKLFQIVNNKEILVKQYMSSHKIQDYSKVPREIMTPYAVEDIRLTALLYLYELVRINKNIKDIKDFSVYYII
jgi:DNA polymerase III epsilon subunit-like protein